MIKTILKSDYLPMTVALFISFFGHGMGGMIISQNRSILELQWNNPAIFGTIMSMIGWGRLATFFIAGKLSDVWGRKLFIILGSVVYIVGLIGMSFSTTLFSASFYALMFGVANSFLDVGIYPALIEAFPQVSKKINTALVIFLRIAQLILPILMLALFSGTGLGINFRISFWMIAAIFTLNLILVIPAKFPDKELIIKIDKKERSNLRLLFTIEGFAFIIYGFISMATFMIIQQFSNRFGEAVLNMSPDMANFIPTFFATGSIIGVLSSIAAQNRYKAVDVMVALTSISVIATLLVRFYPTIPTLIIGTALIGFAAAGGVMQMGLTLMTEVIPIGKGLISGIYLSMGSFASIYIPRIVTTIEQNNHLNVMLFNAILAVTGLICAIIINIRYKHHSRP